MKNPLHSIILRSGGSLLIFLTVLGSQVIAQQAQSCAEKLELAQTSFETGKLGVIPSLLTGCLKSGFKKEEELSAFKLLIQTYLLNDKVDQADSAMYAFLKRNPEYKTSSTDHSSFVYLYNNFEVKPLLSMSFHGGTNIPFLTFVDRNQLSGFPVKPSYSTNVANIFIAAGATMRLSEKMELGFEAGFSSFKFSYTDQSFGFQNISYQESHQRLEIPVTIGYDIKSLGKYTLYAKAGPGIAINLATSVDISDNMTDINNPNDRTGETLNRKDSRAVIDAIGQVTAGMKYKITKGFLFAEVRSSFGILNQSIAGGSTQETGEWFYAWRDPGFRMNTFNINIGYTYIFYKPSKRKE
jgi:hypothetical protein